MPIRNQSSYQTFYKTNWRYPLSLLNSYKIYTLKQIIQELWIRRSILWIFSTKRARFLSDIASHIGRLQVRPPRDVPLKNRGITEEWLKSVPNQTGRQPLANQCDWEPTSPVQETVVPPYNLRLLVIARVRKLLISSSVSAPEGWSPETTYRNRHLWQVMSKAEIWNWEEVKNKVQ